MVPAREDRTCLDSMRITRTTNEKISARTPVADVDNQNASVVKLLLAFVCFGNAERYTAIVVSVFRCRNVKVCQRNLLCASGQESPHSLPDDGVVLDLLAMLIAKYQNRGGHGIRRLAGSFRCGAMVRRPRSIRILVLVLFFLAPHPLLRKALLVHLVRHFVLAVVVLVESSVLVIPRVPQRTVPTPTPSPPRRAPTPILACESKAIVVKSVVMEMVYV